jgi:hypothetical protein
LRQAAFLRHALWSGSLLTREERAARAARLQLWPFLLKAREVAYRTTCAVEPFALFAELLAAAPLLNDLGRDAVTGLTIAVVVVDVRVGRVPWALALQRTGTPTP